MRNNEELSGYCFYVKTKTSVDFHICIIETLKDVRNDNVKVMGFPIILRTFHFSKLVDFIENRF